MQNFKFSMVLLKYLAFFRWLIKTFIWFFFTWIFLLLYFLLTCPVTFYLISYFQKSIIQLIFLDLFTISFIGKVYDFFLVCFHSGVFKILSFQSAICSSILTFCVFHLMFNSIPNSLFFNSWVKHIMKIVIVSKRMSDIFTLFFLFFVFFFQRNLSCYQKINFSSILSNHSFNIILKFL